NSLAGRRGRSTLLVLAVALAAALTVAVGSALSTAEHSMERQMAQVMGLTDLIVANKYSGALPAGLLGKLRALPGVQVAAGRDDAAGVVEEVHLKLKPGVDPERFAAEHQRDLPDEATFRTATTVRSNMNMQLSSAKVMYACARLLVMLSAAFIILTSLTTAVTE